jgi:hypothetical protein
VRIGKYEERRRKKKERKLDGVWRSSLSLFSLGVHSQAAPLWTAFGPARNVSPDISLRQSATIIREWLSNCHDEHKICQTSEVPDLPRRILDISPRADRSVVLVESLDRANRKAHYATLSHCWGKTRFIQTTKDTLAQRKDLIEWAELPQTFQDAITVARELSLQYLWIDSLCIIQDDELDWLRESAQMASVYSKSFLNIAATGASDGRGGCLSRRRLRHAAQTHEIASFKVGTNSKGYDAVPTIFVRLSFDRIHRQYSADRSTDAGRSSDLDTVPLLSRAWVFQERYLAPRTLHFHPTEMIMECKSGLSCECTGLNKLDYNSRRNSIDVGSIFDRKNFDQWSEVVEEYSKLRLTRESDRLISLNGVATVFQSILKTEYLAGIWPDDLARGLLWDVTKYHTLDTRIHARRLHDPYAPSWSWASLELCAKGDSIIFPAARDDTFSVDQQFAFVGTNISPQATDSNHTELRRELRIRSITVLALLFPRQMKDCQAKAETLLFDQDFEDSILITAVGMHLDVPWSETGAAVRHDDSTVYCLRLGSMVESDPEIGCQNTYCCTLVVTASSVVKGSYERIGVVDFLEDLDIFNGATEVELSLV